MRKQTIALLLALSLAISGCGMYQIDTTRTQSSTSVFNTEIVDKIKEVSIKIEPADKVVLQKMILGYSSFVKSAIPETHFTAFKQLEKVKEIYGWPKEKNKDFSDAFESILQNPKYTNGIDYQVEHKMSEVKDNLSLILESVAEGLR